MTQGLRPSQFIYSYGPGAILEGQNGPRIILNPERGLFYPNSQYLKRIHKYDIVDERMSKGLLDGGKIFKLPSNANEQISSNEIIYHTNPFPQWKLCLNFVGHAPHNEYILYIGNSCPVCHYTRGIKQEAIRFVTACPHGHMDEINWDYLTHRNNDGTKGDCLGANANPLDDYFIYYRGNGAISSIRIECPRCDRTSVSFAQAYSGSLPCTSRMPENEEMNGLPQRRSGHCTRRMKIIQRQAASLRVVDVKTLLQIKSGTTSLQKIMMDDRIRSSLMTLKRIKLLPNDKISFENILSGLEEDEMITKARKEEILRYEWNEIHAAMDVITAPIPQLSYSELILEEFKELFRGSGDDGIPPISLARPKSEVLFEMDPSLRQWFPTPSGRKFMISPVSKLSTITVQTGYRREIKDGILGANNQQFPPSSVVYHTRLADATQKMFNWFPGVTSIGEGLFIRLDDNDGWQFQMKGNAYEKWMEMFSNNLSSYSSSLFRSENNASPEELHPVFVWWHTIAHTLIRTIGEEAGYSSSSIKERVFLELDGDMARGGILLYATQAGNEGTLGGLISLAPYFDDLLDNALDQINVCSGDPLCIEEIFKSNKYNGASCYGCTMNSETSCEHRNMWLDRHIVLENMP